MNHDKIRSLEAEQSVIGAVLLDNAAFQVCQPLRPEQFSHAAHSEIWSCIGRMISSSLPVDVVTLFEELRSTGRADAVGGISYINSLASSVPSARSAKTYSEIVRERASRREIIAAAEAMIDAAMSGEGIGEIVNRASIQMASVNGAQTRRLPRRLEEVVVERTGFYEKLAMGQIEPGWPTGLCDLDNTLSGGLRPGKVYIIAARPGVGKSSLAAQLLIEQARRGKPGLFLSQEMEDSEVADRAVANIGRIDYGRLQSGKLVDQDWSRAVEMLEEMRELPIWIDDQPSLTITDIRSKVRSIPGLKVLVLDYLQLCGRSSDSFASSRNGEIEEISRALKGLSKELGLAVLVLSQLNRKVEERSVKRPTSADLRDSGAIEQDADVIMLLWEVESTDSHRLIGCNIDKNRQGRKREIPLAFYGDQQRWASSAESIDRQAPAPAGRGFRG